MCAGLSVQPSCSCPAGARVLFAHSHHSFVHIPVLLCVQNGQSALHLAAGSGQVQLVELLLQRGADVEARDVVGPCGACRAGKAWECGSRVG